jgi:hypothetical protein
MMRGWGRVDTRRRGINMSHRCSDACSEAVVNRFLHPHRPYVLQGILLHLLRGEADGTTIEG